MLKSVMITGFGIWKTIACDNRTPRHKTQTVRLYTCEKLHATHQVEACRDMVIIIPFRKPQLSFFNNEMYELQLN